MLFIERIKMRWGRPYKNHMWDFSDFSLHALEKIYLDRATVMEVSQFSDGPGWRNGWKPLDLDQMLIVVIIRNKN